MELDTVDVGLTIELLGPPRITVAGRPLEVDTRKAVAVLAALATAGRQTREGLASLLWPDSEPERARGALRRTLSVLNAGLGGEHLVADRNHVALADDTATIDIEQFERLTGEVAEHGHDEPSTCPDCIERLRDAARLHRGSFLQGFAVRDNPEFADWVEAQAEHYRRALCGVLDRLTRAEVEQDELDDAVSHTQQWLEVDPLNEQVHVRLMLLHAWRGERALAVKGYRELVGLLDRELGVAPLESTTRVYEAVLEGRIDRPGQVPESRGVPVPARPAGIAPELPFVGRDEVLREVESHLGTGGAAALIEGEAGIGKSRFVEELEASFHRAGAAVLPTRCHPGDQRIALSPIIDLLRSSARTATGPHVPAWVLTEVSRLAPDIVGPDVPGPVPLDAPGAQQRFYDAIWAALEAATGRDGRPGLVIVEDAQFADEATLDVLAHLCNRLARHRLSLVLTFRSEDVTATHPLRNLWRPDTTEIATWLLARLDPASVEQLARFALPDRDGVEAVIDRLVLETEGLPLALTEYVRWLVDNPASQTTEWPIPSGVRELVEGRLAGLGDTARQLISAAAVIGHDVSPEVLERTAGRTVDEVVAGLDELVQRGLLVVDGDVYDFTHEKVRTIVCETTSPARRRLLHSRVADALAPRARRPHGGHLAAVVAEHARLGGRHDEAADWSVVAGDHAITLLAHTEAAEHYERALALDHPSPVQVHRRLARSRMLMGDYPAALESYEAAAAHATNDHELAEIEHELGALHLRRGNWGLAEAHLTTARSHLGDTDPTAAARVTADLGLLALNRGELDAAAGHAREALALAENAADRHALAQARNLGGLVARRLGRIAEAHRHLEHAAALAATLPDPSAYIAALNNLALSTLDAGEHARAEQLLRTALDRCERLGDRHRQAAILNNLADLHHLRGDEDVTMTLLKEAVGLFAEVGSTSPQEPEIWKLTEW